MFRLIVLLVFCIQTMAQVAPPFHKGVNLTNWFQYSSAQQIQLTRYSFDDFQDLQSLGVDVIRLPINLHPMTSGDPDFNVDPLLLEMLDQVVDWTEALDMHLILDNHTFDPSQNTGNEVYPILMSVWPQLADHFKDRGPNLYYEILNEPHGISDLVWNTFQINVVNAIREVDTTHTIIVGPAEWNSYQNLDDMPLYPDPNLIYTFHFYDPFIFTHQGASWTSPSMVSLAGVPFPYQAGDMPACPPDLVGTWIQNELQNYGTSGRVEAIQALIDIAMNFSQTRGVPIFCGEFGAYMPNADNADRVQYYDSVVHYLDSLGIPWTMWDYHGGFGLYQAGSSGLFDHDLNIPLVEALGFNVPEQTPLIVVPDSGQISIYEDYIMPGLLADHSTNGTLTTFSTDSPRHGNYCISWENGGLYEQVSFQFSPYRDLSYLMESDHVLSFWLRGTGTPIDLQVRFVDTKNALPEDHPWRMSANLTSVEFSWNDQWQYIQIPLSSMTESGSWDGSWYSPAGLFNWAEVQNFEFSLEQDPMEDSHVWIDHIRIMDSETVETHAIAIPRTLTLNQNYPNPFNATTLIPFNITDATEITLMVYDLQGRFVASLLQTQLRPGAYEISWDGRDGQGHILDSGIYILCMQTEDASNWIKMSLLK